MATVFYILIMVGIEKHPLIVLPHYICASSRKLFQTVRPIIWKNQKWLCEVYLFFYISLRELIGCDHELISGYDFTLSLLITGNIFMGKPILANSSHLSGPAIHPNKCPTIWVGHTSSSRLI